MSELSYNVVNEMVNGIVRAIDIKDFEDYTIDETGRVFSKKSDRYLKANLGADGYHRACLFKDKKGTYKKIHRLLADHFIPNPNNYSIIDHINQNQTDNRLENLKWCNTRQNGQNRKDQSIYGSNIYKIKYATFQVQFRNNKGKYLFRRNFKTLEEATEIRDYVNDNIKIYEHLNPWNLKGL